MSNERTALLTGSPWLPACLAAVMLLVAACSAARLAIWLVRRRHSEPEADILHMLMGVTMAGMLESRLSAAQPAAWLAVFGSAAVWFAWQAIRARIRQRSAGWRSAHPEPHAVECAAMFYMLWPARAGVHGHVIAMPGMSAQASAANPALALVLSLFMLGYMLWTANQLTVARRNSPSRGSEPVLADAMVATAVSRARPDASAATTLAPRIAALSKITM